MKVSRALRVSKTLLRLIAVLRVVWFASLNGESPMTCFRPRVNVAVLGLGVMAIAKFLGFRV